MDKLYYVQMKNLLLGWLTISRPLTRDKATAFMEANAKMYPDHEFQLTPRKDPDDDPS